MYRIVSILILFFAVESYGQNTYLISGKVFDKQTNEVLPYTTVYDISSKRGTVTNLKGKFSLKTTIGDTINISYIGYSTIQIVISKHKKYYKLFLEGKENILNTLIIRPDNDFLYDLVAKCRKKRNKTLKTSKSYMRIETDIAKKQVELVECYYNSDISGQDIEELHLKNGRIALVKFRDRYFHSVASSKAIYKHKLFKRNKYYPNNPLSYSKRRLKKYFKLKLVSRYFNENNDDIFVIEYHPVKKKRKLFEGKIWINHKTKQIIKITLNIKNTSIHPFIPLFDKSNKIDSIDLNITKTFNKIGNRMYLNSIYFNYKLRYIPIGDSPYIVKTNSFMYFYDFVHKFYIPRFKYHDSFYQDYRQISASRYNDFFWRNIDEFKMRNLKKKNDYFVNKEATLNSKKMFIHNEHQDENETFEHHYIFWNKKRIRFRSGYQSDKQKYDNALPSDKYNMNIQIYMDINYLNDSLDVVTQTIFDPYESYYKFPQSKTGDAFINMYFDIAEIQRRKLEKEIKSLVKSPDYTIEDIDNLYEKNLKELKVTTKSFCKSVQRGTIKKNMLYWNNIIADELDINNISLFELYKNE